MSEEKEATADEAPTELPETETGSETQTPAESEVESEALEADTPAQEKPPTGSRAGGFAILLVLLFAFAAAGGGYYLWMELQLARQESSALQARIDRLDQRSATLEQRQGQLDARLDVVPEHEHSELLGRVGQLEAVLFDLRSRLGQERRGWLIAEVEYLLRIADHRLVLDRDTPTAIAALQSAIARLQALNDPNFTIVIDQLHADIDKLSAVPLPDRMALARQLADLSASIERLPLSTIPLRPESLNSTGEAPVQSFWQQMWQDIVGLVSIRRPGEADQPLLVPEQRYFLRQNLKLKLEAARLALLSGNAGAWKSTLREANTWMQHYFDPQSESVRDAIDTLHRLIDTDLNPPLPRLDDTRRLLQQAAMQQPLPPEQALESPQAEDSTAESAPETDTDGGAQSTAESAESVPEQGAPAAGQSTQGAGQ